MPDSRKASNSFLIERGSCPPLPYSVWAIKLVSAIAPDGTAWSASFGGAHRGRGAILRRLGRPVDGLQSRLPQ